MALFMDEYTIGGRVTAADVAGKILCLVEGADAEAAEAMHREAHGLVVDAIHPVTEGRVRRPPSWRRW